MQQTVENGVIVFTVNITRWSANKKLRLQHTKATAEEMPPTDVATLGVRKVYDPKALAPFEAIRKEVERLSFSEGTSFFGGVAVPKADADAFAAKLRSLQERFDAAKVALAAGYEVNLAAWKASHPGWENTLEGALTADEALSRFSFRFNAVEIVMAGVTGEAKTDLEQNIVSSKSAFVGQLYAEIAQMASAYRKDSLMGKEKATTRGLSSLQSMRKKLNGLAFLDYRIRPLVNMIEKVEAEMPITGSIDGQQFATLMGVTSILSDPDMMQQYGDQVSAGRDANSLFRSMLTPPPVVSVPVVQQTAAPAIPATVVRKPGIPQQFMRSPPCIPQTHGITPPPTSGWSGIPSRVAVAA